MEWEIDKRETIKVIECDGCGKTLVKGDEILCDYTQFEKYMPHQYVYHHYCSDCMNSGRANSSLGGGFVEVF